MTLPPLSKATATYAAAPTVSSNVPSTSILSSISFAHESDPFYFPSSFSNALRNVSHAFHMASSTVKNTFLLYWQAYPFFRTFVYLFCMMTAIPNLIFCFYVLGCLFVGLSVAVIGVTMVQGSLLFFGLLLLAPFLCSCIMIASVSVAFLYVVSKVFRLRSMDSIFDSLKSFLNSWNQILPSDPWTYNTATAASS